MPLFTWVEDSASRSATIHRAGRRSQNSYKKSWKIFGTSDDIALHNDIQQTLWTSYLFWQYPGQPLNQLQAESYTVEYLGDKAWQLSVTYVSRGADDDTKAIPVRRSRSFDTSGGTTHITQQPSYGTGTALGDRATTEEKRYSSPSFPVPAPDCRGAIGFDGQTVHGVDIVIPALQWVENYDVPTQYVTNEYVKMVSALTGCTNNAQFRSFRAGEVLFVGSNGSQDWDEEKGDSPWSLSFKFIASPNADGNTLPKLKVGDIEDIEKLGHEYMTVKYADDVENNALLKKPVHVYVNQVYPSANFALLGIGVT